MPAWCWRRCTCNYPCRTPLPGESSDGSGLVLDQFVRARCRAWYRSLSSDYCDTRRRIAAALDSGTDRRMTQVDKLDLTRKFSLQLKRGNHKIANPGCSLFSYVAILGHEDFCRLNLMLEIHKEILIQNREVSC